MSSFSNWQSFEEEEEEEEDYPSAEAGSAEKDNVIFAIDSTLPMHEVDENAVSHFNGALRCAVKFLQNKIIQSESDQMGLVFFGTEKSHNEQGFKHIYVKYDLDVPDVDRILELENLQKRKTRASEEFGSSADYSLAEVFWTCSNLFSAQAQKVSTKRVFLITHNDAPHAGNVTLRKNALVRAQDLQDLGISIELFPVQVGIKLFRFDAFYNDLPGLVGAGTDSTDAPPGASRKYEEMQKRVFRREVKKRTAFRVPLQLFGGLTIGVKGYNLTMEQKKANYTYLDRRTNAEVRTVTSWCCSATGDPLMPSDMKSYWVYGGEKIVFTKDEVNSIKHFCEPGLILLGFKDQSAVKFKHNIKHAAFVTPDESEFTGSSSVFAHLLDRLHARDKIAICRFVPRRNAAPRIVALLPEKGQIDKDGDEVPYGFHVIYMPFADDIRHIPSSIASSVPPEPLDLAKEVVRKLLIKNYDAANYENPVLQKHYNNLQAIALMKDFAEEIEDKTLPSTEAMYLRAGSQIKEFKEVILEGVEENMDAPKKKRSAPQSAGGTAKKAKGDVDLSEAAMRVRAAEGKLQSLTIPQLSEFLSTKDIKPVKKKADLVKQVENFFTSVNK